MNGPNREPGRQGPERLLGGYATGNLSEQEKQELFQAGLRDQKLFDALLEEQALHDLLELPGARAELLDALAPQPKGLWTRFRQWMATPVGWGAAGAVAAAAILLAVLLPRLPQEQPGLQVASRQEPKASATPATASPPPPAIPTPPPSEARKARATVALSSDGASKPVPAGQERDGSANEEPAQRARMARNQTQQQAASELQQAAPPPQQQQTFDQQAQRQDSQQMRPRLTGTGPAAPAAAGIAEQQQPAPREEKAATPAAPLDYALLKRNAEGGYEPATVFRDADAVRIRVTARQEGFVALTRRGEPKALVSPIAVRAGQTVQLPASGFLLPSSEPYRLEFLPASQVPGAVGVIGGFRPSAARAKQDAGSVMKDAAAGAPLVVEILIKGSGN
ncbi:MAG: hypothetical protein JNK48_19035 [Bryobacterales bacterium]|nr:hypothetical protein [Bryobacterales bacterium]